MIAWSDAASMGASMSQSFPALIHEPFFSFLAVARDLSGRAPEKRNPHSLGTSIFLDVYGSRALHPTLE
jgi:hypothetical protein